MGLFSFLGISAEKQSDKVEMRKAREIMSKVVNVQLTRFGQEISDWKNGISAWEDPDNPQTVDLIRVYNDLVLDPHLTAAMETRKSRTLSKDYKVVNEEGEENDEETDIFNSIWFRDYVKMALDSRFFGYSVIQFGNRVGKSFDYIKLVPREYVYPQKQAVRESPYSNYPCLPLTIGKYAPWTQYVGKRGDDLGLLAKAGPMLIYKKTAQGAWTEFAELFGAPFRMGKTNIRDKALNDNMYFMLENMGRNAFGVFDHEDELEFIGDKKSDAYEVYDKLIERANSEISKLILGSTMVMDDGSSQSQAEVHERTLEAIDKDDSLFIQEIVNNDLIPWLNQYHDFNITGVWKWDDAEKISKEEQFKRDIELIKTGKYEVPASYISETYGVPLTEVEEEDEDPKDPKGPKGGKPGDLNNSLDSKKKALSLDKEGFCGACNGVLDLENNLDDEPINWNEKTVTDVINGVYAGKYTAENLPVGVYNKIAKEITKGLDQGLLAVGDAADTFDPNFVRSLKNNAYVFSGAKTFQQVREMSDFIADNQGRRVPFGEYEVKAREVFDTYNRNWLRTEVLQAENSAQMASRWQEIAEEEEFLPFLKYDTVGDKRVRDDHKKLDGVTRPVNDPFWDTYYPPNGWRCRCDVQQEDEEAKPTNMGDIDLPMVPPSMQINVGKKKVLFGPKHPYFIVEDQFKELKEDNFNLPIPKDAQKVEVKAPKKEVKKGGFNVSQIYQTSELSSIENVKQIMDDQDGAGEIANEFKTNIGLRGTREVGAAGSRKWQAATGANNSAVLETGVLGHCSTGNRYINIRKTPSQRLDFEAIKLDYTEAELLKAPGVVGYKKPKGGYQFAIKGEKGLLAESYPGVKNVKFALSGGLSIHEGKNVISVFTHEVNHLIQNKYDPRTVFRKSSGRPKMAKLMREKGVTLKDSVTFYGEYNESEFFAEALTVYIHSNNYMKTNHNKLFNFIEDLLKEYGIDKTTFKKAG